MGRYMFTLPSAHVYASLRVSIYGTGNTDGDGHETHDAGYAGIRNFETGEARRIRQVGFEWAWYSSSVRRRGSRHERPEGPGVGARRRGRRLLHYTKVQLTYKYGRLHSSDAPIARARQPAARDARRRASSIAQIASGRRYRLAR